MKVETNSRSVFCLHAGSHRLKLLKCPSPKNDREDKTGKLHSALKTQERIRKVGSHSMCSSHTRASLLLPYIV